MGFEGWVGRMGMGKGRVEGARAVVLLEVFKVCVCVCVCVVFLCLLSDLLFFPFFFLSFFLFFQMEYHKLTNPGKVQTSCGFGVPLLTTAPASEEDASGRSEKTKPVLLDRDTMGHWSRRKIETNTLLDWQREYNSSSLDGCPGMRSAMRDQGGRVWVALLKARVRRVGMQREALLVGGVVGGVLVLFALVVLRRLGFV